MNSTNKSGAIFVISKQRVVSIKSSFCGPQTPNDLHALKRDSMKQPPNWKPHCWQIIRKFRRRPFLPWPASLKTVRISMVHRKIHLCPVSLNWPKRMAFLLLAMISNRAKQNWNRCWWTFWLVLASNPYQLLAIIIWAIMMAKIYHRRNNSDRKRYFGFAFYFYLHWN